ncbi:hypothetical protein NEF87_000280 [Candidatus Lokiarchaeum ossiferum]|uniref:Frag1/DRAM/Sfk1 family protein n=1 Tax=Candidatus Lokiarchaeum ossiferum TaxID=2951803 RepID=A0ABY6HKE7_9ARCH|nr:hypothetical protein NEF87_000280 [Candidatus Lokiarchaeum sp. B-35]
MDKQRYFFERIILYTYFFLGIVITLTILNSMFHYPLPYKFWFEPISRLGGIHAYANAPNQTAGAIFASGMQYCTFICVFLSFAYIYWEKVISPIDYQKDFKYHPNRCMIILTSTMGLGAFLLGIPYDHTKLKLLHALGALIFIGSFSILNIIAQLHKRIRKKGNSNEISSGITLFEAILIVLIFIMMIVYLIAFMLFLMSKTPSIPLQYFNATSQKIILILCLVAIFNLDPDDVLLESFWTMDHLRDAFKLRKRD